MTHTIRAAHAKHQNPSIVSEREACSPLRHKPKTTCGPQPRRLAAIPFFHAPLWSLQTCFDPICLWLFFRLGWLLFLCLFWGLEDTDCTSRCIRFYSDEAPTKNKKQKLRKLQRTSAPHDSHKSRKASKPKSLFQRERERAVQHRDKRINSKHPTAKKASSHSFLSCPTMVFTNLFWPHLPLAFLPPWLPPFSRPLLGPGRHRLHI